MTIGNIISKLFGCLYIIPWCIWFGTKSQEANSLFSMGYTIYSFFLIISSAGIPAAIAKQIAYFNSFKKNRISNYLFIEFLKFSLIIGFIFSIIMYLIAPIFSILSGNNKDLILIIRTLSLAIFLFPCLGVLRGFFNGNNNMKIFALSQIVDQITRVIYMLISVFIIMKLKKGNYVIAVAHSTFAAFIGVFFSIILLLYYIKKMKIKRTIIFKKKIKFLIIKTCIEAIPFIISGVGFIIFKLLDQFTFFSFMKIIFKNFSNNDLLKEFSIFSANPDKFVMLLVSLATSISITILPLITELYVLKKYKILSLIISNNLQMYIFIISPIIFSLINFSNLLNNLFYSINNKSGDFALSLNCLVAVFLGLYMLLATILIGIKENFFTIKCLFLGFFLKLLLQYFFIFFFGAYGIILTTLLSFIFICFLMLKRIYKIIKFNYLLNLKIILLIFLNSLFIFNIMSFIKNLILFYFNIKLKIQLFFLISIVILIGISIYIYISYNLKLINKIFFNYNKEKVRLLNN